MKNKLFSIFTALAMVLGILVSPFTSAHADEATETKSVTIHKILLTKEALDAHNKDKKYNGNAIENIQDFFGDQKAEEIDGVYFKLQKLNDDVKDKDIDVTNDDQWTDVAGKDGLTGSQDKDGKVVPKEDKDTKRVAGLTLDTTGLKGTYRIVEDLEKSTYKGNDGELLAASKAVPTLLTLPITNDTGIVEAAHVYPKNTQEKPEIDKNFSTNNGLGTVEDENSNKDVGAKYENYDIEKATATADLGKSVPYEVKTKVDAGSKYQTLNWKDTMSNGLTFNKDEGVTIEATTVIEEGKDGTPEKIELIEDTDYKLTADDRGFTLSLTKYGLDKLNAKTHPETGEGVAVEFTLTYSATVNKNAIVDKPEKNDIKLEYSNNPKEEKKPTPVTPENGELRVTKTWDGKDKNEDAEVVYTLSNGTISAAVMLNGKEDVGTKYDLGNGITFEVTGAYAGTFKGEALKTGDWTISERVAGYDETIDANTAGTAAITNTKDEENPTPLNPTEPKVQLGGRKFVKTNNENKDSDKLERLAGAEFYVKNAEGKYLVAAKKDAQAVADAKTALDEAVKAYNDLSAEEQKGDKGIAAKKLINDKQDAYNKAFKENATAYRWTTLKEYNAKLKEADPNAEEIEDVKDIKNIVVLTSDAEGRFEISGLEYKKGYELEEKTAPKGYAKLSSTDKQLEFEVKKGSYAGNNTELQYNKDNTDKGYGQQIKNKNVTIPQTGGIGSLIFVVAGLAIMAFAYTAYKKSQYQEA